MNLSDLFPNNRSARVLAPMADLSHAALRHLIEYYGGCDFYFSEMISTSALVNKGRWEEHYRETSPCPERVILQLVGSDEDTIVKAATMLIDSGSRGIDINMGCSAPAILKKGGGATWLKNPQKAASLLKELRNELPKNMTLSAKIRLGVKESDSFLIDMVKRFEDSGIDFISINPKIIKDKASRPARWEFVSKIIENLTIPVIGNGHIESVENFKQKEDIYKPAGIMVGRHAVRKPWFFADIAGKLNGDVDLKECMLNFHELLMKWQPEEFLLSRAKRFYSYFYKNFKFGHRLFVSEIWNSEEYEQIFDIVLKYIDEHPEERYQI